MTDPFHLLGPEPEESPRFADALRESLDRLQSSAARFEALCDEVPEAKFTDDEWRIVERAAEDVAQAVEAAEEGYVAVQFDSHAWYRIMESLERIQLRLESTVGMMEQVRDRV
jgi:hypothetical protein